MHVFVYGTLTDPDRAGTVLDEFEYRGPAELTGLRRIDGCYPTLVPGGRTSGRLLWTPECATLDRYEGVESGLYVRVSVPYTGGADAPSTVSVYVGDPERLDASEAWPSTDPFPETVRRYCSMSDVSVHRV
ncbi:gamma-glutamylcyclotransferase family protein [Halorientalis litorea]|jgi:gamma-glutamylaminecyclotransferase|uniref:gamma-glutamylcyclotransferase family protein n=1 Tax=Halorientalis litorea TaxID=2931977 RepID=UPI001FF3B562|nr:gamma-glutamylcyclotransferase family protein [Halorientalis litorea]